MVRELRRMREEVLGSANGVKRERRSREVYALSILLKKKSFCR